MGFCFLFLPTVYNITKYLLAEDQSCYLVLQRVWECKKKVIYTN